MNNELIIGNDRFTVYLSENEIQTRIEDIGAQISKDYAGKIPIFVGVLNGASIFMADLIRSVTCDLEIDFLKLSSYGDEKLSSGSVKLIKDVDAHLGGRDILIVEDIVDTGLSVGFIKQLFLPRNPASLKVVTLLNKKRNSQTSHTMQADYIGFEIPDKFVIGYGLDYSQRLRNLRAIYALNE
ncbi:MAG: hypoxanthine phosphoribosyltransferase [Bacteroidota bacterium]